VEVAGEASPLVAALDEMEVGVGVSFGGEMRLLGYSVRQEGGELVLDMYWQALRAMEAKYKVFVHLVKGEGGKVVAQHDGMPREWSYPTSLWGRGEVFVDRVRLEVSGVEGGEYRLVAGVYEPGAERLEAVDRAGRVLAEEQAILDPALKVGNP
jgi:hypothetical protein